jgi:hypothetical protein
VHRRAGDRWLAGEPVEGVAFAHHDTVEIVAGPHVGRLGAVVLLMGVQPEPLYLVEFAGGAGDRRVRQSELRLSGRVGR